MWKQISLTEALQGYLAGQNVKLVDLVEETVVSLQDVFKSMQENAVFFAVTDPVPETESAADATRAADAVSPPDPEPKSKKQLDEAEKAYQSRKISDTGKLRSLRAAGWDIEKIATEFGCSGQTVRNTMKREGIE